VLRFFHLLKSGVKNKQALPAEDLHFAVLWLFTKLHGDYDLFGRWYTTNFQEIWNQTSCRLRV